MVNRRKSLRALQFFYNREETASESAADEMRLRRRAGGSAIRASDNGRQHRDRDHSSGQCIPRRGSAAAVAQDSMHEIPKPRLHYSAL